MKTETPRRVLRRAALAAPLALLALALAFVLAPSSGANPATLSVGDVPAPASTASVAGPVAAGKPLSLTVVLHPRDPSGLAALAAAVSTPGSPSFHDYLTVGQFARRFGAGTGAIDAVRTALRAGGLKPGVVAADGLSMTATGSAAHVSHAFDTSLVRYREASGRMVYANTAAPRLPAAAARYIADVIGLDDVLREVPTGLSALPHTAKASHGTRAGRRAHAASGNAAPQACSAAASFAAGYKHERTIDQIAQAYGINGLYARGDFGSGVTIALAELEQYPDLPSDLGTYQSCFFPNNPPTGSLSIAKVDGGAPPNDPSSETPGGEETSVDIENISGLAPGANIEIFQGPNGGNGVYDTLSAMVNATGSDFAQVLEDSWGQCEKIVQSSHLIGPENSLFDQAAIQGQSFFTSSDDRGSEGCQPIDDLPADEWGAATTNTELAVDDPAGQPYATGVGATVLNSLTTPPAETGWNDFGWGAGGGGVSMAWAMPTYQSSSLAPGIISSWSSGGPCDAGPGAYCREVPDVTADGSTNTGYVLDFAGRWQAAGGTSTAAPVWAAIAALVDRSNFAGCTSSTSLGFFNPLLYEIAGGVNYNSAFNDITSGDNNPSQTGAYPATAGYDMDSGLGSPLVTDGSAPGLAQQLCQAAALPAVGSPQISVISSPLEASVGTPMTINGSGFTPFANVRFGSTVATQMTYVSSSELIANVPPGSGIVPVTVRTTAGTSSSWTFTYAPTATISAPAPGAGYTQGQSLTASYTCAAASGTPSCTGTLPAGSAIDTSVLGSHQFSVTATDSKPFTTVTTSTYTIVPPPSITISGPASQAVYTQGQVLPVSFGCASTAPVKIVSCAAPAAVGAPIDTQTTGAHTFTVSATDSNGISTSQSVSYTVVPRLAASVTAPANGASYVRGSSLHAAYSCSVAAPVHVTSCTGSVANGASIDTSALGHHTFTLSASDSAGTNVTTIVTYTIVAPVAKLSGVRQASARWVKSAGAGSGLPVGTTFSFTLNQAATVRLTFLKAGSGRLKGGRCLAPKFAKANARSCARSVGALTIHAHTGVNKIRFLGRTPPLGKGRYTVTLVATGKSGQRSPTATLRFTIAAG
ncbi:MAG TPA: protease pro-enzyme activation domain-containing protein [Solirubrobacteraceae bacterium]|nr:protease pro-enzyme activation domain-containing protein [Solirubrobacteraceae bacterium]